MKYINENDERSLDNLIGEQVTFFCCRYIYTGKLIGIDEFNCVLKDPAIIYETGEYKEKKWKNSQSLGIDEFYIAKQSIESFGKFNKK